MRRDKNGVIIRVTEIIPEFRLPLMHFALFIRRTAGEMGSQTALKDGICEGKRANFTRRELARMGLV
jgi:hypothetical protein